MKPMDGAWPLSLREVDQIVEHLLADGTREGLLLADLLNSAMGASARRFHERHGRLRPRDPEDTP